MTANEDREEDGMDGRWQAGDIVQVDPDHDETFGGCLMVVSEPKAWGAQGYFDIPGENGRAYYRLPHEAGERVGRAVWVAADADE